MTLTDSPFFLFFLSLPCSADHTSMLQTVLLNGRRLPPARPHHRPRPTHLDLPQSFRPPQPSQGAIPRRPASSRGTPESLDLPPLGLPPGLQVRREGGFQTMAQAFADMSLGSVARNSAIRPRDSQMTPLEMSSYLWHRRDQESVSSIQGNPRTSSDPQPYLYQLQDSSERTPSEVLPASDEVDQARSSSAASGVSAASTLSTGELARELLHRLVRPFARVKIRVIRRPDRSSDGAGPP
jgi:hypothetical protein